MEHPAESADHFSENVSPISDLSRNLTTLRTMSRSEQTSWMGTPQLPTKVQLLKTPDSNGSFRLKLMTPGSECGSDSEAEPSPAVDLHRRVVLSQVSKTMHESPFFLNKVSDPRRAKKRSSLGLSVDSSPMRKNSSVGYSSSTSDGFALEEITLDDENVDKENKEPNGTLASLLSAPMSEIPMLREECKTKKFTSARRNLSFAGNCHNETPIKSKRLDDESARGSKRTKICLTDRTNISKISKYRSESDIDRAAVEFVIDRGIEELLPTTGAHKRCALPTISPQTMSEILDGKYDDLILSFEIIDCRWPYEFEGGHIKGAKNLYTQDLIAKEFLQDKKDRAAGCEKGVTKRKNILIFHCEFSSERGPKMSQFLREEDRASNVYPKLFYPELYILEGGYKDFFDSFPKYCVPQEYRKMVDQRYMDECRLYRSQSKSFDKQQDTRKAHRSAIQ